MNTKIQKFIKNYLLYIIKRNNRKLNKAMNQKIK